MNRNFTSDSFVSTDTMKQCSNQLIIFVNKCTLITLNDIYTISYYFVSKPIIVKIVTDSILW